MEIHLITSFHHVSHHYHMGGFLYPELVVIVSGFFGSSCVGP